MKNQLITVRNNDYRFNFDPINRLEATHRVVKRFGVIPLAEYS
ncbi:hypothetical protein [Nitrosococcus watsonii]|nr:hypothetical protein [Nitrosococcus watsonii]